MPHLRFKRHYKLLVLLALVLGGLIGGAGDQPIVAHSLHDTGQVAGSVTTDGHTPAAPVDILPDSVQIPRAAHASGPANSQ